MDDRFDTGGRSIALINNPRTQLEVPFATASNLRETLNEIGNAIEPLLDDAKERVERLEVVEVSDRRRHDGPRLCPRLRGSPGEVSELDWRRLGQPVRED